MHNTSSFSLFLFSRRGCVSSPRPCGYLSKMHTKHKHRTGPKWKERKCEKKRGKWYTHKHTHILIQIKISQKSVPTTFRALTAAAAAAEIVFWCNFWCWGIVLLFARVTDRKCPIDVATLLHAAKVRRKQSTDKYCRPRNNTKKNNTNRQLTKENDENICQASLPTNPTSQSASQPGK